MRYGTLHKVFKDTQLPSEIDLLLQLSVFVICVDLQMVRSLQESTVLRVLALIGVSR